MVPVVLVRFEAPHEYLDEGDHLSVQDSAAVSMDVATLEALPREAQELAITSMLDQSRQWLDRALEATNPAREVAEFKAFVATVAEAARQKKLSEGIQLDALEMVRRSERALGVAIRKGQEAGEIATAADAGRVGAGITNAARWSAKSGHDFAEPKASSSEFFSNSQERTDIYAMTDGVSDEQFEQAMAEVREEGNPSRANVVRKVTELGSYREQQDAKWERVELLAHSGLTSAQIAREVGLGEQGLRKGAASLGIEFPADKIVGRSHRIDPIEVIEQMVMGLEVTQSSLDLADLSTVTAEQAQEWLTRIHQPLVALKKFQATLKGII